MGIKPKKVRSKHRKRRSKPSKVRSKPKKREANPPHGEKNEFVKVTITIPPKVYRELTMEVIQRKIDKKANATKSAVVREALFEFLK